MVQVPLPIVPLRLLIKIRDSDLNMTSRSSKSCAIEIPSRAASASAHRAEHSVCFSASPPPKWPSTVFLMTLRPAEHEAASQAPSKLTLV
ncbi:hypothetical protein ACE6H2_020884 [Prunus campanulata]